MSRATKPSKHSTTRKGSSSSANPQPAPTFLFVANRLVINAPERDHYYHHIPPSSPDNYGGEFPSPVMRYRDGDVTDAPDFYWHRDSNAPSDGQLLRLDAQGQYVRDNQGYYYQAREYKTFGVAACNPLLPIMVTEHDPLVTSVSWDLLRIFHPRNHPGMSQVATINSPMGQGGGPVLYAAGRSPSWIPGLVPRTYGTLVSNAPSTGLGGELPIILGLMALTAPRDSSIRDVFAGHNRIWRHGRWTSDGVPRGHPPTASDDPSAFVVKVFLDPDNPYSTRDWLENLEWHTAIVRES
ncbi:hypothetical protein NW752_006788 [Fusarium irregulare]|uniref:Uncharacterized protein n=1 Tax=Fusarium irregulare TaxID=2494466 RepID=A0A9W8UBP6_9HYPO|nr:hypothetical protein NW766_005669 [Fusarium irregulare]KAJ4015859.1 hypothetical protein NW752_006788 [Fusarium irregulare]